MGIKRSRNGIKLSEYEANDWVYMISDQKLMNNEWIARYHVIMQQRPTFWISIFRTDTDSGHQMLQNFEIIVASNYLIRWNEFFMDNSFAIEECNEHWANVMSEYNEWLSTIRKLFMQENIWLKQASPYTCCINRNVFDIVLSSFALNLMTALCFYVW